MVTEAPSTVRARRLRERRSRGAAMVAPVEVGKGGIDILIRNELLNQRQTRDRKAVGEACLAALGNGPRAVVRGLWGDERAWRPTRGAERDPGPFPTNPDQAPKPTRSAPPQKRLRCHRPPLKAPPLHVRRHRHHGPGARAPNSLASLH